MVKAVLSLPFFLKKATSDLKKQQISKAQRPFQGRSKKIFNMEKFILTSIIRSVPKWVNFCFYKNNELIVYVYPSSILPFLSFIKDHINLQYKQLMDVTAVDFIDHPLRFEIVYNLLSLRYNTRIRVKTRIDEFTPISSVTSVYSCAAWWERRSLWICLVFFFLFIPTYVAF